VVVQQAGVIEWHVRGVAVGLDRLVGEYIVDVIAGSIKAAAAELGFPT
jgi:hypothetical protein